MAIGTAAAILASAAIGAGASVYTANKQEEAAEEQRRRLEREEEERRKEAERIARETRPEGETLSAVTFGTGGNEPLGSTSDFLVPKTGTALGGTGSSGLGFSV